MVHIAPHTFYPSLLVFALDSGRNYFRIGYYYDIVSTVEFKPIHAGGAPDDWACVNPQECHRFKDGNVQMAKGGYWFPYRAWQFEGWKPHPNGIMVNLTKAHVLVAV